MKKQNILIALIVVAVAAALVAYQTGIIPDAVLAKTGIVDKSPENRGSTVSADDKPATPATNTAAAPQVLQQDYIKNLLATVTPDQKKALLADTAAFRKFVDQEAMNLSLLQAARSSKLQSDAMTQFLVQRGADNVLREIYMTSFINSKIPQDFPTEEQIKQYYETNKDNLKISERLAVWQIFLPVDATMDEAAAAVVAKEADRIAGEIRADKLDFGAAALQYSRHESSRLNGGYMGIIKTSELIPEVLKVINDLKPGQTSTAIKSTTGYHILRKGEVFPAQDLTLDQIRDEIRTLLINQARNQLKNAINTEVMKTYPVAVDDPTVEKWRQDLLSTP